MSRTTGRTLTLLALLQVRREWSGPELRERLEVSDRTLRRDIEDLRELGYGIEARPGVGGGYRLGPGANLPPLTITPDEAVAIAVGLRAAQHGPVSGMEEAAARALAKLEQSLSSATRAHVGAVARALVPLTSPGEEVTADVVVAIAHAIAGAQRVRVRYRPRDQEPTDRRIEPHRVVQTDRRWYLTAWDCDREGWRTFRLDRITAVAALRETFTARDLSTADLRASTTAAITTAPYPYQVTLGVHAPADVVAHHFPPTIAQVSERDDGTSTLTTGSSSLTEIAMYMAISGLSFQVLDGRDAELLRQTLTELAARLSQAAVI